MKMLLHCFAHLRLWLLGPSGQAAKKLKLSMQPRPQLAGQVRVMPREGSSSPAETLTASSGEGLSQIPSADPLWYPCPTEMV